MVVDSLNKGKNVYVEKPLAISVDQLKEICKSYSSNKCLLMVGYNRRYSPSIQYLKRQLKDNFQYSIYYQVNAGFIPKDKWYQSPDQGGRIIGEVSHFIDTLQYLLNADPIEVFASSTSNNSMPEQDNTFITIKFSNGSTCVIAYLADGDKNYSKEKILITGFQTNIEFDNFKTVRIYKDGKSSTKKFLIIDKGQKHEMEGLSNGVENNFEPIPFNSLILNTYAAILAVKSIQTKLSYKVSLADLINE
jgi:polar amino acid transport system substrate-binding protein